MCIRIAIALEKHASNPFHRHEVKNVKGCPPEKPRYRIRIGEFRATFRIIRDQLVICVVAVGKKKNFKILTCRYGSLHQAEGSVL